VARKRVVPAVFLVVATLGAHSAAMSVVGTTGAIDVAAAVTFRTEFGLNSTPQFAAMVAADPTASTEYGVPLLPAEVADLASRAEASGELGPVTEALGADPEFAGLYIDQRAGGELVVRATGRGTGCGPSLRRSFHPV
jgi:hypothetical protein